MFPKNIIPKINFDINSKKIVKVLIILLICIFVKKLFEIQLANTLVQAIRDNKRESINNLIKFSWNLDSLDMLIYIKELERASYTPMRVACEKSDIETIEELIKHGASVNHVRGDYTSPLITATLYYGTGEINENLIEILLKNGANPNEKVEGNFPCYPLLCICYDSIRNDSNPNGVKAQIERNLRIIKLLIKYNADIYATSLYGSNVLHILAGRQNFACIQFFINNYKFDVNALNDFKKTPLMETCNRKYIDIRIIKLFLEKGADKNLKDMEGKTALDYAKENGYEAAVKLLEEK